MNHLSIFPSAIASELHFTRPERQLHQRGSIPDVCEDPLPDERGTLDTTKRTEDNYCVPRIFSITTEVSPTPVSSSLAKHLIFLSREKPVSPSSCMTGSESIGFPYRKSLPDTTVTCSQSRTVLLNPVNMGKPTVAEKDTAIESNVVTTQEQVQSTERQLLSAAPQQMKAGHEAVSSMWLDCTSPVSPEPLTPAPSTPSPPSPGPLILTPSIPTPTTPVSRTVALETPVPGASTPVVSTVESQQTPTDANPKRTDLALPSAPHVSPIIHLSNTELWELRSNLSQKPQGPAEWIDIFGPALRIAASRAISCKNHVPLSLEFLTSTSSVTKGPSASGHFLENSYRLGNAAGTKQTSSQSQPLRVAQSTRSPSTSPITCAEPDDLRQLDETSILVAPPKKITASPQESSRARKDFTGEKETYQHRQPVLQRPPPPNKPSQKHVSTPTQSGPKHPPNLKESQPPKQNAVYQKPFTRSQLLSQMKTLNGTEEQNPRPFSQNPLPHSRRPAPFTNTNLDRPSFIKQSSTARNLEKEKETANNANTFSRPTELPISPLNLGNTESQLAQRDAPPLSQALWLSRLTTNDVEEADDDNEQAQEPVSCEQEPPTPRNEELPRSGVSTRASRSLRRVSKLCLSCKIRSPSEGGPDGYGTLCKPCNEAYVERELQLYRRADGGVTADQRRSAGYLQHVGFKRFRGGPHRDHLRPIVRLAESPEPPPLLGSRNSDVPKQTQSKNSRRAANRANRRIGRDTWVNDLCVPVENRVGRPRKNNVRAAKPNEASLNSSYKVEQNSYVDISRRGSSYREKDVPEVVDVTSKETRKKPQSQDHRESPDRSNISPVTSLSLPAVTKCLRCNRESRTLKMRTGPDGYRTLCGSCSETYRARRLHLYLHPCGKISVVASRSATKVSVTGFFTCATSGNNDLLRPYVRPLGAKGPGNSGSAVTSGSFAARHVAKKRRLEVSRVETIVDSDEEEIIEIIDDSPIRTEPERAQKAKKAPGTLITAAQGSSAIEAVTRHRSNSNPQDECVDAPAFIDRPLQRRPELGGGVSAEEDWITVKATCRYGWRTTVRRIAVKRKVDFESLRTLLRESFQISVAFDVCYEDEKGDLVQLQDEGDMIPLRKVVRLCEDVLVVKLVAPGALNWGLK